MRKPAAIIALIFGAGLCIDQGFGLLMGGGMSLFEMMGAMAFLVTGFALMPAREQSGEDEEEARDSLSILR